MFFDFNYLKRFPWGKQKTTGAEEMRWLALKNKGQNIRHCPVAKNDSRFKFFYFYLLKRSLIYTCLYLKDTSRFEIYLFILFYFLF